MNEVSDEVFWTKKIKEHWKAFLILIIIGIYLIVSWGLVFFGYMNLSWIGGYGTWTFDQFSVGNVLLFLIQAFLWVLLLSVIHAVAAFCIFGYLWWNNLPEDEKTELKKREEKEKSHKARNYGGGGGGMTFFFQLAFLIALYVDGNFLTPFGNLPYIYFIYVYLVGFLWIFFLIIVPACILGLIWFIKNK